MLETLDGRAARRWAITALAALAQAREEIDALNVFPVPDGDTGTNLYLTLESAIAASADVPPDASIPAVAEAFARGALLGARGNSGVIGAQLLRGWADTLAERGTLDASAAVECFRRADAQAWRAVNEPVEGTILSVSRAAAIAAEAAPPELAAVVDAAATAAREALARTPDQLPILARAGVVDAGGRGLVVLFDALADVVTGASRRRPGRSHRSTSPVVAECAPAARGVAAGASSVGATRGFEVMYLLDAEEAAVAELRRQLAALGDSLVVVGSGALWNVHVHVDDAGAAVEAGMAAGRAHRIRITSLTSSRALPALEVAGGAEADESPEHRLGSPDRRSEDGATGGVVACAAGPGLAELFAAAGAVVAGAPGVRASTGQLLDAARRTGCTHVAVLPNDSDTLAAARAVAGLALEEGIRLHVLATRAQVQGLAAAAVHSSAWSFADDVAAMAAAAAATRDGAVTIAARDAWTSAGPCSVGDVLGVVDGDFTVLGSDLAEVASQVVTRLLSGGGELVTLVVGEGGHEATADVVAAEVRRRHRHVEVSVLDGGQPRYPLLIGVE